MAKTIGRAAIERPCPRVTRPSTESPAKTSAPFIASASVRAFGLQRANRCLVRVHALGAAFVHHALRVAEHDVFPLHAQPDVMFGAGDSRCAGAVEHHFDSARSYLPTSSRAFNSAAPEMIAVPCWSS